jgi:hypothetical protein
MPSPAAQAYFNSFDPATQQQIQASWGGADLMDQWFQAAQQAGAVSPDGTRKGGGGDQGAGVNTGSGQGGMTPQKLRQKAKNEGWSEDFDRFSDELLQGWITRSWDPNKGRFRSEHAPQGATGDWAYVEKPTEGIVDPQGVEWGPHGNKVGVNLSALGLNTLHGSVRTGGGGGGGGGGQQGQQGQQNFAAGLYDPNNPLQNHLVNMARSGSFGNWAEGGVNNAASLQGGGVWSGFGADFSQKFNPLKPRGGGRGGNRGGGGGQPNPFETAAQNPTIAGPAVNPAPGPVTKSPFLAGQNGVTPTQASPMQNKLTKMFGGNNTFLSRF